MRLVNHVDDCLINLEYIACRNSSIRPSCSKYFLLLFVMFSDYIIIILGSYRAGIEIFGIQGELEI